MNSIFLLARVLLKGNGLASLGGDSANRKKKRSPIGNLLLFAFLVVYLTATMVGSAVALYDLLSMANLQFMMIGLYVSLGTILVFFSGLIYVISIFYYSSDVEKLLPLPLKADAIIGAKLLVTAVYEYLFFLVLVVPPLIVFAIRDGSTVLFAGSLVVVAVFLPIIPLCLASVLVMVVMRFTPFARNKDRFNLVSSVLVIVLALGFTFFSQSAARFSQGDLIALIQSGSGSIARLTTILFPGTAYASEALSQAAANQMSMFGQLGLLVLVAAVSLVITLFLASKLYFKGVIGLNASSTGRRRLVQADLERRGSQSAFWTYVLKDVRILVRTPIFFMNNVMMNFLWPAFFIIPVLGGSESEGLAQGIELLRTTVLGGERTGAGLAVAIVFAMFLFVSGTNGITESALSREGRIFYFMKMIPMSWTRQIAAKITVGLLFSLAGALIPLLLLVIFVQPPLWFVLAILTVLPGALLLPNLTGIIFELYWPKLKWDNEQKAVKQNLNVVYGILLAMLFGGLAIGPVLLLSLSWLQAMLIIALPSLLLSALLVLVIRRIVPARMRAIES
jgi:ABC-2 type transport system permease protein